MITPKEAAKKFEADYLKRQKDKFDSWRKETKNEQMRWVYEKKYQAFREALAIATEK